MVTAEEEKQLLEKAKHGSESAFEKLVIENQALVYNTALKLTGSPDDAMDVSQDVFLRAFLHLNSFRGDGRLSSWLYRLTYNAGMDHIRRNRPKNVVPIESEYSEESEAERVPDTHPEPAEELERREESREVWEAVNSLSDDKRQILLLREFSGLSYTEIGERLGLESGTVKSRLSRARAALANKLRESGTFFSYGKSNNQKKGGGKDV